MIKNVVKFAFLGLLFIALAGAIIYGIGYWKYQNSPEYRAEQDLKNLEKKYAEDPYGGETPEETLRLFIDALKKGDTDLAAKYFILDKQAEWREDLAKIKEKNLLGEMIRDLENLKVEKIENETARYYFVGEDGLASTLVLIQLSSKKWKIRTL